MPARTTAWVSGDTRLKDGEQIEDISVCSLDSSLSLCIRMKDACITNRPSAVWHLRDLCALRGTTCYHRTNDFTIGYLLSCTRSAASTNQYYPSGAVSPVRCVLQPCWDPPPRCDCSSTKDCLKVVIGQPYRVELALAFVVAHLRATYTTTTAGMDVFKNIGVGSACRAVAHAPCCCYRPQFLVQGATSSLWH